MVITTADEDQSKAYRYQIDRKIERKEMLQNVPFYVIDDPPGVKVGEALYQIWHWKVVENILDILSAITFFFWQVVEAPSFIP